MQVVEQLKQTSPDRFLEIYSALENNGFGPLDGEVAKAMKFRPQAIRKLPMAQRARRAQRRRNQHLKLFLLHFFIQRNSSVLHENQD